MRRAYIREIRRTFIIDTLLLGVSLVIFCWFHHGKPKKLVPEIVTETTPVISRETFVPEQNQPGPNAQLQVTPADTGILGGRYAEKFSDTVVRTEYEYRSPNVALTLTEYEEYSSLIHVVDIYVKDIRSLRTCVSTYDLESSNAELRITTMERILQGKGTDVLTIASGDTFATHPKMGFIVRNGNVYSKEAGDDVCLVYNDGVMEILSAKQFSYDKAMKRGVYQSWSFGPTLLDAEGRSMDDAHFEEVAPDIDGKNPRMAIGYYEPGHYCLICVDGRRNSHNTSYRGATLSQLSRICETLGCTSAYNLDGGQSAGISFLGSERNYQGRPICDGIYICEPEGKLQ